jgi:hypothetical protein
LISGLDLRATLQERFGGMAQACFQWICSRNQMKVDDWHAQLILIKNSAYAWRQMVFYLSMLPPAEMDSALDRMEKYFVKQSEDFQLIFRPAFDWLQACAQKTPPITAMHGQGRQFLGWSDTRHWLMRP